MFLLWDYMHVIKCMRNKWLTEKMGELEFTNNNKVYVTGWNDLKERYEIESENLVT